MENQVTPPPPRPSGKRLYLFKGISLLRLIFLEGSDLDLQFGYGGPQLLRLFPARLLHLHHALVQTANFLHRQERGGGGGESAGARVGVYPMETACHK